ncbi:MAG TPA: hypothetical protein DCE18_08510, partial [Syntrophobacteraceae bacterium]|nr:hypothetical protein [Syntrophobacteraceae bacterium]
MATQFPVETEQPRIQVSLPVGRHTLELVVEDSAGLRSAPDRVTISVVREAAGPNITDIDPKTGAPGGTVDAVITGANLDGASEVSFSGAGISAEIIRSRGSTQLLVRIAIDLRVATGDRSFSVVTPGGVAESPRHVVFTVARSFPTIEPTIVPTIRPTVLPTLE